MRPERHHKAGHRLLRRDIYAGERLWERCTKTDTCWIWTGPRNANGYGITNIRTRTGPTHAHRAAYALVHGEVPAGFMVRHTCDNPPCVNPAHLRLGTNQENTLDKITRGRGQWQRDRFCKNGHFVRAHSGPCQPCATARDAAARREEHDQRVRKGGKIFHAYFDQHIAPFVPPTFGHVAALTDERRATAFARVFGCYGFAAECGEDVARDYGVTRERVRQLRNDVLRAIGVSRDVISKIPYVVAWKREQTTARVA